MQVIEREKVQLQQRGNGLVPAYCRPQERRPSSLILRVDLGLARLEQQSDDGLVPSPCLLA